MILIVFLVLSIVGSLVGFLFRKTLSATFKTLGLVLRLLPIAVCVLLVVCLVKGVPVAVKVYQYQQLSQTNLMEIRKDEKKYNKYKEQAVEVNAWLIEYKQVIEDTPALAFAKDKIESFTPLPTA